MFVCSARATRDARCCSLGFYLIRKGNEQMRVAEGTLPLGVRPVRILCDETAMGKMGDGSRPCKAAACILGLTGANVRGLPEMRIFLRRSGHLSIGFTSSRFPLRRPGPAPRSISKYVNTHMYRYIYIYIYIHSIYIYIYRERERDLFKCRFATLGGSGGGVTDGIISGFEVVRMRSTNP